MADGITGTDMATLCAQAQTQQQRDALGCPPEVGAAPAPMPAAVPQQAAAPQGGGLLDYADIAQRLQQTPQLAQSGALSGPELAGGQMWQQTAPAAAAYQKPGIAEMLKALFGSMTG